MNNRVSTRNLRNNSNSSDCSSSTRMTRSKRAASGDDLGEEKENLTIGNTKNTARDIVKNNAKNTTKTVAMDIAKEEKSPVRKSSRLSRSDSTASMEKAIPKKFVEPIVLIDNLLESETMQITAPEPQLNPFARAKKSFHRSGSFKIVGRIEEKAAFTSFWYDSVAARQGAAIYISGNPGTGKTALVDELLAELGSDETISIIKLNCMMLKDPLKAFNHIASELKLADCDQPNPYLILSSLEAYFTRESSNFHVCVVDEVDQIGMKDSELLCRLLAMAYLPGSKVSVIGIANSIDLTERFLPRLKLLNCEPQVLHFPQYTIADISAILTDRLERINAECEGPFIDKIAIEFTARKVASTGDLRRALDMIRQALDLAEDEWKLNPLTKGPFVKISHVARIVDKFGASQSGPLVLLKSLNLHQKVILASYLDLKRSSTASSNSNGTPTKKQANQVITVQTLYNSYSAASMRPPKLYEPVTRSEFIDLISNLESMSVMGRAIGSSTSNSSDVWMGKMFLLVPGELVLQMLEELATIKTLFGL